MDEFEAQLLAALPMSRLAFWVLVADDLLVFGTLHCCRYRIWNLHALKRDDPPWTDSIIVSSMRATRAFTRRFDCRLEVYSCCQQRRLPRAFCMQVRG